MKTLAATLTLAAATALALPAAAQDGGNSGGQGQHMQGQGMHEQGHGMHGRMMQGRHMMRGRAMMGGMMRGAGATLHLTTPSGMTFTCNAELEKCMTAFRELQKTMPGAGGAK